MTQGTERTVTLRCGHCQLREPVPVGSVLVRQEPGSLVVRWPCEGCLSGWWAPAPGDDAAGCRALLQGAGVPIRELVLADPGPWPLEGLPEWSPLIGQVPVWPSTRRRPPPLGWLRGMWRRPGADR
jgi:hypothetical protein